MTEMKQAKAGAQQSRSAGPQLPRLLTGQQGALLLETLVALIVLGVLGSIMFSGVQTSYIAKRNFDIHSRAENIVRTEIESVYAQAYKPPGQTYTSITTVDGFTITSVALPYSTTTTDIERVRVTVDYGGNTLETLEAVRANQ